MLHNMFHLTGHDTGPGESGKKYRPLFLDHFDKKEAESIKVSIASMLTIIRDISRVTSIYLNWSFENYPSSCIFLMY